MKKRRSSGTVSIPGSLGGPDKRRREEDAALAEIEARMRSGALAPAEAEKEILELALARFDYLSKHSMETLRGVGLEMLEEPEFVESRTHAPRPDEEGEGR